MSIFPVHGPSGPLTGLVRPTPDGALSELPLVLLHGIQGTARSWAGVMEQLPSGFTAVAPNLRGRAGSVSPAAPEDYHLDAFAADLEAVLARLDRPVLLAGWSMGVLVALSYARDFGLGRVRGLALLSGTACPGDEARWFAGTAVPAIAEEAEARARSLGLAESAAPVAVAGAWLAAREADCRETLAAIRVSTLVVHGTEDDQCPLSHGRLLAEQIAGSRWLCHPGGGHNLLAESPELIAGQLADFRAEQDFST